MERDLWEILVPVYDPGGREIPLETHKEWDEEISKISGGLTILNSAKGQWTNVSGKIIHDKMIPVRFLATDEEASKIVDITLSFYYHQECIMAYKISHNVIIRYKD